jgi:hypothetical protein
MGAGPTSRLTRARGVWPDACVGDARMSISEEAAERAVSSYLRAMHAGAQKHLALDDAMPECCLGAVTSTVSERGRTRGQRRRPAGTDSAPQRHARRPCRPSERDGREARTVTDRCGRRHGARTRAGTEARRSMDDERALLNGRLRIV